MPCSLSHEWVGSSKAFLSPAEPAPSCPLPAPPFCFIPRRVRKWWASLCRRVFTIRSSAAVSRTRPGRRYATLRAALTTNRMSCWSLVTFSCSVESWIPQHISWQEKIAGLSANVLHGTFNRKAYTQIIYTIKEYRIFASFNRIQSFTFV